MNSLSEVIWGRYAVNTGKISREKLQQCIEKQGVLKSKGKEVSLIEIIKQERLISLEVIEKLSQFEDLIPGYKILEVIGSGGIGVVYKAYSVEKDEHVAIKILNPEYTDNTIILARFLQESEISTGLMHPNIVKGYKSGRIHDLYYLILEYIDGISLAKYVKTNGCFSSKEVIEIAYLVSKALCYAWAQGLTHRDIKPENLIIAKNGDLKVCDFGLAKLADANIAVTLTGTIVGSPYYISPEQIKGTNIDYRSDIYSLGATLYFLLTGKYLFNEETLISICNAHVNDTPIAPSNYTNVDPKLEELIITMLSKDAEQRSESPEDFKALVENVFCKENTITKVSNEKQNENKTYREDTNALQIALLAVSDSSPKEEIVKQLQEKNVEIYQEKNEEKILNIFVNKRPQMTIISTQLEITKFWEFINQILSRKKSSQKIVILLDDDNPKDKMQALLSGIKRTIPSKPSAGQIKELIQNINMTLYKDTKKYTSPKLKGDLKTMKLTELLQVLQTSKKIGILRVSNGFCQGDIWLKEGMICLGECAGLSPHGSIYELCSWDEGHFEFEEKMIEEPKCSLNCEILGVLFESMRLNDESKRLRELLPAESQSTLKLLDLLIFEEVLDVQLCIDYIEQFTNTSEKTFIEFLIQQNHLSKELFDKFSNIVKKIVKPPKKFTSTSILTKSGNIYTKGEQMTEKASNEHKKRSNEYRKKSTSTKISTLISSKNRLEDTIIQHLLLSHGIITMSELSDYISVQVNSELKGVPKKLREVIVEKGVMSQRDIDNLYFFRDGYGESFIPSYEIIKVLGEGGLAIVYLGRNKETGKTVAIKVFAPTNNNTSSTIARFMREAEAAKSLDHPNIVKANDFGTVYGIYYLIMEYVPGISLAQLISNAGRLEETRSLEILEQIATALVYAWEHGIIHRDIKPSNILSDGELMKICDLGLAKALTNEIDITQEGSVVGTPHFMSPEQFNPDLPLDYRTDIYSLGVTFYVMLTGYLPFNSTTRMGIAQAHMNKNPVPLENFNVIVSKGTRALLFKMLSKTPEERTSSPGEFLKMIQSVRAGTYKEGGLKNKLLMAIAATIILTLSIAGIFLFGNKNAKNEKKDRFMRFKSEINLLISTKDYELAKKKIIGSNMALERKKELILLVNKALKLEKKNTSDKKTEILKDKSKKLWEKAQKYFLLKRYDKALEIYSEIVASYPKSPYYTKAKMQSSIALKMETANQLAKVFYDRGMRAFNEKKYQMAFELFKKIELDYPQSRYLEKAQALKQEISQKMAEQNFVKEFYSRIQNDYRKKNYKAVIKNINIFLKKYPQNERASSLKKRKEEIVKYLKRKEKEEKYFQYYTKAVRVNLKRKKYSNVIKYFKKLSRLKKYTKEVEVLKGKIKEKLIPKTKRLDKVGVELVLVNSGTFFMGTPKDSNYFRSDERLHKVQIKTAFYIGKYELTVKQYKKWKKDIPKENIHMDHPIVKVSWDDASNYCEWLSEKLNKKIYLPTEAQWEYACRAGSTTPYSWGEKATKENANYTWEKDWISHWRNHKPIAVGKYQPNAWGIYDMHGNVWEWTSSPYSYSYDGSELKSAKKKHMVVRGGGWNKDASKMRSATRAKSLYKKKNLWTGFRIVVEIPKEYHFLLK